MLNSRSLLTGAIIYDIPHFVDDRGAIDILEIKRDLPFECQRIFYTYTVPEGCIRGEHAHKTCEQFLISIRGIVAVKISDGLGHCDEVTLDSPSLGLWLPHGCWGEQYGHSPDSILLVLASLPYDNDDYIRDYDTFVTWKRSLTNDSVSIA